MMRSALKNQLGLMKTMKSQSRHFSNVICFEHFFGHKHCNYYFNRLKDVVAGYNRGKGKHGEKETSETNYKKYLEKNFASVHGLTTPKWAKLDQSAKRVKKDSDDDSDDENGLGQVIQKESFFSSLIIIKSIDLDFRKLATLRRKEPHSCQRVLLKSKESKILTRIPGRKERLLNLLSFIKHRVLL